MKQGSMGMTIYYSVQQGMVTIHQCLTDQTDLVLPDQIQGMPVTKIGAYAFSSPEGLSKATGELQLIQLSGELGFQESAHPLCGKTLTSIQLPKTITQIGDYAFFNCINLQYVSMPGNMQEIEGGAFQNCESLTTIELTNIEGQETCLKNIITDIQHEVDVYLHYNGGIYGIPRQAKLTFPQYFEETIENAPARIFEWFARGSGYRYRQCFLDGSINYREYDSLLPVAKAEDNEKTVVKIAMERIRYPYQLSESAQEQYMQYLKEHNRFVCQLSIQNDWAECIEFMAQNHLMGPEDIDYAIALANKSQRGEILSFLMDYRHTHFEKQEKSFEL